MNPDNLHTLAITSPLGQLRLFADDDALRGVYLPVQPAPIAATSQHHPILLRTARQLHEYFAGTRQQFDIPLHLEGTAFQRRVWQVLREIPFAATRSYAELAAAIDHPRASRAVGAANGKNPISIIVPCHRVLGSDGSLTGYAGGPPAKRWLLDHETRSAARASTPSHLRASTPANSSAALPPRP
ncbi:methylated-DNA--[protein]-cysteine S-methyltransferase [Nannocystis sp.]|uniref:methylated-DNA--[protein]-cysteine S-methyltransferase n=1 Tax=Nannocystis sp. TaxID=1962667 RepID=UPI002425685B|nr:methylated-DNA--[protein]-cysteine S-methyltransferase [Nannocystis sp.]MBK7827949.1 methylated-DNA--[protein]-cysteine S-methyltransferase [Nannocystis sp.]MBK9752523.1 methylated-DNA--[protein]-cysteine S-methyltransferase [Nannocystis sp.]